ncbi:MAG: DivIVA domain-containing protein [Deltaproteobacteria bacterium]|nr:DivIVA domain-containing protein [Deltaproteobacteria bacterium]
MTETEMLTPADIRQQQFSIGWRGFAALEVKAFLDQVAEAYAALMQENEALQADLERQQAELGEFKKREQLLKDTLINAQQVIETMKANAQKESELLIHEAEIKAEKMLQEAFSRQGRLRNDIEELKRIKTTFAAQVRGILESHLRLLEQSEASE